MTDKTRQDLQQAPQYESSGCLPAIVRIMWLALGNAFIAILAGMIIQKGVFSVFDILFWINVGLLVLIRFYDITRLKGLTAECKPATLRDWGRYSALLLLISTAIWIFAHTIRLITQLVT